MEEREALIDLLLRVRPFLGEDPVAEVANDDQPLLLLTRDGRQTVVPKEPTNDLRLLGWQRRPVTPRQVGGRRVVRFDGAESSSDRMDRVDPQHVAVCGRAFDPRRGLHESRRDQPVEVTSDGGFRHPKLRAEFRDGPRRAGACASHTETIRVCEGLEGDEEIVVHAPHRTMGRMLPDGRRLGAHLPLADGMVEAVKLAHAIEPEPEREAEADPEGEAV